MRHKCSFYQAQEDREPCTFNIIFDMSIFQFITTWTNSSFISQIETGTWDAREMLRHWSCMSSGHLWVFPCSYALSVGEKTSTSDHNVHCNSFSPQSFVLWNLLKSQLWFLHSENSQSRFFLLSWRLAPLRLVLGQFQGPLCVSTIS